MRKTLKQLLCFAVAAICAGGALATGITGNSSLGIKGGPTSGLSCPTTGVCAVTFNILTGGYGATCNGIVDDGNAFSNASAAIAADSRVIAGAAVTIVFPPGSTCLLQTCNANGATSFPGYWGGIPGNVTFQMTGATITSTGGCTFWTGGGPITNNGSGPSDLNGFNQPFQTVTAGSSCVTMLTASDAANYPVGATAMASAIGTQIASFPPNPATFEYLTIASSNASTGVICFSTPLINSYKSTWIDLGNGNCVNMPCGSRGMLSFFGTEWNHTVTHIGATWNTPQSIRMSAKNLIVMNEMWTNANTGCIFPTLSGTVTYLNSTFNCNMEADKLVDKFIVDNTTIRLLPFQSSGSFHNVTFQNGGVNRLGGTPQDTVCNNSTIGLGIGTTFGATQSFEGNNCVFSNELSGIPGGPPMSLDGAGFPCCGGSNYTYTGSGIFVVNGNSSPPIPAAQFNSCVGTFQSTPSFCSNPPGFPYPAQSPLGQVLFFQNNNNSGSGFEFRITDNNFTPLSAGDQLGTFNIVSTLTGGSLPPGISTSSNILVDAMRSWSCTNCTGTTSGANVYAVDLSNAGAQGQPIWTYSKRTYTCANNVANIPNSLDINFNGPTNSPGNPQVVPVFGNFVFVKINVTQADTASHPGGLLFNVINHFDNLQLVDQVTGAGSTWGVEVDLTHTGLRTVNLSTVSGAAGADILTAPSTGNKKWISSAPSGVFLGADISAETAGQCPVVTVEWQADRTTLAFP